MLQYTYLFVGIVALITTLIAVRTADDSVAILTGLMSTIAWALWAYSSLNVTVVDSGSTVAQQYPSLAAFGLLMAVPGLFVALTGPLAIAKHPASLANQEVRN